MVSRSADQLENKAAGPDRLASSLGNVYCFSQNSAFEYRRPKLSRFSWRNRDYQDEQLAVQSL